MNPSPIDDAAGVDARRFAVGLPPLAEKLREIREGAVRSGETTPEDARRRRLEIDAWERSVGWHD